MQIIPTIAIHGFIHNLAFIGLDLML